MLLTIDQFFAKYLNQGLDVDRVYKNQCVDVFKAYNIEVVGGPSPIYGNAIDFWTNYPAQYYDKIINTPEAVPQKGDVIIWGKPISPYTENGVTKYYGHIAVCKEGYKTLFYSFDQNWPYHPNWDDVCHFEKHTYTGVLGWLRPKQQPSMLPKDGIIHMDMNDTQRKAWELLTKYMHTAKHGNEEGAMNTLIDAATIDNPRLQTDLNNANAEIRDLDARVRDLEKERGELQKTILDLKDRMSKQDQEDIDFGSQLLKAQNDLKHTEQALLKAEQEKDDANKTCDTVLQEMATKLSTTDTTIAPHPTAILDALTDLKKQNEVLQTKVKQRPLDRYSIFERIASIIRSLFHQKGGDAQ